MSSVAMARLNVVFLVVLVISLKSVPVKATLSGVATGSEVPLALPADKIMRISASTVEFEHHGILPISADVEAFQHWEEEMWPVPLAAVLVGFDEVVPTIFQGEVVRFDVYDPLYIRTIRVAISTEQFQSIQHQELIFSPTSRLFVEEKGTGRGFQVNALEEISIFVEDGRFQVKDGQGILWEFDQRLYVWADQGGLIQINSFKRGTGTQFFPRYRGRFELVAEGDSFLVINEVSLEDYLIQVVPSEMPISWPLEALKAQAVAARTYAVAQAIYSRQGHLGFHVADSTNSQVYNNQPEAQSTTRAIQETAGQILVNPDETISSTYFFSTSPRAILTDLAKWNDRRELALEGNSPWFRWKCTFTRDELTSLLKPLLPATFGEIIGLKVETRDERGRVTCLAVLGSGGKETIVGELNIRQALKPSSLQRTGDSLGRQSLLPSSLFFLDQELDANGRLKSVTVYGGGSGHNLGMSQWGAKGMAEAGYDYATILSTYYPEAHLITHSEQLRY
ncbi:MAG: SpoIID/LytB domain-containing protein [Firmicutes bacterium]|nr:SpoIID/LytB domain-containing protein [Bacillota bacterium]